MRQKTHKEFVKEVKAKYGNEYTVVGRYVDDTTNILIQHNRCKSKWEAKPYSVLRCSSCFGKPKKTHEEFIQEINYLVGNEYTVLGNYTKGSVKLLMRHNTCGYEWNVIPSGFLYGSRCPECNKKNKQDEFKKVFCELSGEEYTLLSDYKQPHAYIKVNHIVCKQSFDIKAKDFLDGERCPFCNYAHTSANESIRRCIKCTSPFHATLKDDRKVGMKIVWCSDSCKQKLKRNSCKHCGKVFMSIYKQPYCSLECRKDICSICGSEFVRKNNETYCSEQCKTIKYTHNCKTCGKEFLNPTPRDFCSKECRIAYNSTPTRYTTCKNCKRTISYKGDRVDYCSTECRLEDVKNTKNNQKKEKMNEKDLMDVVSFRVEALIKKRQEAVMNLNNTIDYRLISGFGDTTREEIRNRDNNRCFICEAASNLEIHHIIPRRLGGNHKVENLITLCLKCHRYVETGNLHYAIVKCFNNAKKTLGIPNWNIEEKVSPKIQLEYIVKDLSNVFEKIADVDSYELDEVKEKLANIIDDAENCMKDIKK